MADETADDVTAEPGINWDPLFQLDAARRDGYVAGLMERTRRLRDVEDDVASLRLAVLLLCAAVAGLAWLAMKDTK